MPFKATHKWDAAARQTRGSFTGCILCTYGPRLTQGSSLIHDTYYVPWDLLCPNGIKITLQGNNVNKIEQTWEQFFLAFSSNRAFFIQGTNYQEYGFEKSPNHLMVPSCREIALTRVSYIFLVRIVFSVPLMKTVILILHTYRQLKIWASFCLLLSFSQSNNKYGFNFDNKNWKNVRWCAWDSNPRPLDGRCRQNHRAITASHRSKNYAVSFVRPWGGNIAKWNSFCSHQQPILKTIYNRKLRL